jgi:hypothetical protein
MFLLTSVYRGIVFKHRNSFARYNYKMLQQEMSCSQAEKKIYIYYFAEWKSGQHIDLSYVAGL